MGWEAFDRLGLIFQQTKTICEKRVLTRKCMFLGQIYRGSAHQDNCGPRPGIDGGFRSALNLKKYIVETLGDILELYLY